MKESSKTSKTASTREDNTGKSIAQTMVHKNVSNNNTSIVTEPNNSTLNAKRTPEIDNRKK